MGTLTSIVKQKVESKNRRNNIKVTVTVTFNNAEQDYANSQLSAEININSSLLKLQYYNVYNGS